MPDSNFVYFYHPDHLGSTSYATDADGELYEHVQYFPSGETWVDQRSNTERLPHLFSGKELDQETGLYYFGARYYDPRVGLWASTDPAQTEYLDSAGTGGVLNPINLATYTYASNKPLTFVDPDGRQSSKSWFSRGLDWVQNGLDGLSLAMDATGLGAAGSWAPDLLNAGISAARGDWQGAGWSLGAMVPYAGAAANTGRILRALGKHGDEAVELARNAGKAARTAAPSSRALGRALEAAGHVRPPGSAAHHIVAGSAPGAEAARATLRKLGIDINDAANGVFLPAAQHAALHTNAYYAAVNKALEGVTTQSQALQILKTIGQTLQAGKLP
jgi:RHS repeat-associated protein